MQTEYALEDILIGHSFVSVESIDESNVTSEDYSKMSDTESYPVWYPAKSDAYAQDNTKALYSSVRSNYGF